MKLFPTLFPLEPLLNSAAKVTKQRLSLPSFSIMAPSFIFEAPSDEEIVYSEHEEGSEQEEVEAEDEEEAPRISKTSQSP